MIRRLVTVATTLLLAGGAVADDMVMMDGEIIDIVLSAIAERDENGEFESFYDFAERVRSTERLGIFTIGGGVPRNWAQQVGPYLEILRLRLGKFFLRLGKLPFNLGKAFALAGNGHALPDLGGCGSQVGDQCTCNQGDE